MSPIAIFFTLALLFAGNQADNPSPGNPNSGNPNPGNPNLGNSGPPSSSCVGGTSNVAAFAAASVNFTDCPSIPTTNFPTAWQWALNSPYTFDYSISPMFKCAQETFTMPQFGNTTYSGSALVTVGGNVTTFNYNMSDDGTIVHAYICGNDPATTTAIWYPVAYESSNRGSYYCAKVCQESVLAEFVCLSNSNAFVNEIKSIVNAVRNVTNGAQITAAQTGCPTTGNSCSVFYSSV